MARLRWRLWRVISEPLGLLLCPVSEHISRWLFGWHTRISPNPLITTVRVLTNQHSYASKPQQIEIDIQFNGYIHAQRLMFHKYASLNFLIWVVAVSILTECLESILYLLYISGTFSTFLPLPTELCFWLCSVNAVCVFATVREIAHVLLLCGAPPWRDAFTRALERFLFTRRTLTHCSRRRSESELIWFWIYKLDNLKVRQMKKDMGHWTDALVTIIRGRLVVNNNTFTGLAKLQLQNVRCLTAEMGILHFKVLRTCTLCLFARIGISTVLHVSKIGVHIG